MSVNNIKTAINEKVVGIGKIATIAVSNENKIRFVIANAGVTNTIVIRGQILGQDDFDDIKTLTGSVKDTVSVSTYDILEIECTTYDSLTNYTKVIASSFNEAGVSTAIGGTTGDLIQEADQINFISSDGSAVVTTNNTNKTIDIVVAGAGSPFIKYVKTLLIGDWIGPSANEYVLTIPFNLHGVVNPEIACYEANGLTFDEVLIGANIDSNNNIVIKATQTPDTRFIGKIVIE
jgi:hypothetical protein